MSDSEKRRGSRHWSWVLWVGCEDEADGSVVVHAEGNVQAVGRLAAFLHEGPAGARVTEVVVEDALVEGHEQFRIRGVSAGIFVVQEHLASAVS